MDGVSSGRLVTGRVDGCCLFNLIPALLSVYMPHSGRDEEDYIEALETVRATLTEDRETGATDLFIGGDLNIEF